jgi:hypothetical protein
MTSEGWFAGWRCDCTDIERTKEEIPALCPTHGEPLLWGENGPTQFVRDFNSGYGVLAKGEPSKAIQAAEAHGEDR